jgi:hypothetical protein
LNSIGDNGASILGDHIAKLTDLSSFVIDLTLSSLGDDGTSKLGESIAKLTNLNSLEINLTPD